MFRIIKADIYKLSKEIYIKIMALVCLIYVIFKAIPFYEILEKISGIDFGVESQTITGHKAFFELGFDGFFNFFIPFLIVIIFSSEFSKKTIRNIAALKIGRTNIFVGKYITFSLMVFVLMLFSAIVSTLLFTLLNGWGSSNVWSDIFNIVILSIKYSAIQIAYASVIVVLSLVVQNGALVIILYFAFSLVESMVSSMIQMFAEKAAIFRFLSYAFPSTYMYEFPVMKATEKGFVPSIISIASLMIITIFAGCLIMKKRDIKA